MDAAEAKWTVDPLPQRAQLRKRVEGRGKEWFAGLKLSPGDGTSWTVVKSWTALLEVEAALQERFAQQSIRVKIAPLPSVDAAAALPVAKAMAAVDAFFRDALLLPNTASVFVAFFLTDVEDPRGALLEGPQIAGFLQKQKGEGKLKRTKRFCAIK